MRYSYIHGKVWRDEKFKALSESQQRLFFYLLTSPHSNILGLYVLPIGYIVEDLKPFGKPLPMGFAKGIQKDMEALSEASIIDYDEKAQICWVKNYLKYNPITNPNQRKAAIRMFHDLPKSPILWKFFNSCGVVNKALAEALSKALPEGVPYTESESESGTETESERGTVNPPSRRCAIPNGFELTDELIAFARKQGVNNGSIEAVFNHFKDHHKAKGTVCLDWKAAWRTWVMREIQFSRARPNQDLKTLREQAKELALKGGDDQ